jgi:hypothetical protein
MPLGDEDGRLHGSERRAAGAVRRPAPRESPADRAADGKAECAQYVGVSDHPKAACRTKPFRADIYFQSKRYYICFAPTA